MRLSGEAASDAEGEADFVGGGLRRSPQGLKPIVLSALLSEPLEARDELKLRPPDKTAGGDEGDVVDFGVRAPVGAGGDGNFEFAGKIVELGIAAEFLVDGLDDGIHIDEFVGVNAGERAAGDVAGYIAASASGGESDGIECIENFGDGFDAEPVELNVLADGEIGYAVAVLGGKIGDGAELVAGEESVGDADAHHEVGSGATFTAGAADYAEAVALGVNAPGAEVGAEPFGRNGIVAEASEIANFVEMIPGVFFAFETFDALGPGFFGGGHF